MHGLGAEELPMQASMLRAEATKFSSWRANEMQNLLSVKDEHLTACHITNAMALRDEYSSNQYHKIWLLGHQLAILLIITGLGLFLLAPLVVFYSRHPEGTLAPWGVQTYGFLAGKIYRRHGRGTGKEHGAAPGDRAFHNGSVNLERAFLLAIVASHQVLWLGLAFVV
jgi:hypothetical protein